MPAPTTLPMADTYAVVQKRGTPAGTGPGTRTPTPNSADTPIYSQVAPRAQRPVGHTEDGQGTTALGRGELRPSRDAELRVSTCLQVLRSPKAWEGPSTTRRSAPDPAWLRPQAPKMSRFKPPNEPQVRSQLGGWVV